MTRSPRVLALALVAAFAAPALAADDAPKPWSVGDAVSDVKLKDMDGKEFSLATSRAATGESALAAVVAAARAAGATDPKAADPIDGLPGLKGEGGVDAAKRAAWLRTLGHEYGYLPSDETCLGMKTLGDAARWVEASASAPIVFMCWKVGCPTTKMYQERIGSAFANGKARLYVLAVNPKEDDATIKGHVSGHDLGWRVLDDRKQEVTKRLGGRKTPHMFVLDAKNALRYAGAIDDQLHGKERTAEQATPYLAAALEAVAEGRAPWVQQTEPVG
jgi:hypothetical protein